jgi:hypothetical protein
MTPEEKRESLDVLRKAVVIANRHGQQILDESDSVASVAATSAAIMMSTFCSAAGMSLHDTIGLIMSIHKHTIHITQERQQ